MGTGRITTSEAARRLDVATMTIRRWIEAGRLRGEKVGDRVLVDEASVAAMERGQRNHRPAHVRDWR